MHKAGFVNIVGNPNVGKSTLMNQLVGEKISIATFKAQTTRHRIMGIVNTEDMQIVFSDTPGVLKPNYKMQDRRSPTMLAAVNTMLTSLLLTEGDRRRVQIEINRVDESEAESAGVVALQAWAKARAAK